MISFRKMLERDIPKVAEIEKEIFIEKSLNIDYNNNKIAHGRANE